MATTDLLFIGIDSVLPEAGDDTICFVVNQRVMFDAGWSAGLRLREFGLTPLDLDTLVFSHLHHDHYLGLPQVLFYRWMTQRTQDAPAPLRLVGPAGDLELVLQRALDFLQAARFDYQPVLDVTPLAPGESLETADWRLRTCASIHPVPGLCYRFEDRASGAAVVYSGDTAYCPALIELARGADLLIHEASFGANSPRPEANSCGHSGAPDAAAVAQAAGVRRLALVHGPAAGRAAAVAAAQTAFAASFWPAVGERLDLP